jgi:hypothetical protein
MVLVSARLLVLEPIFGPLGSDIEDVDERQHRSRTSDHETGPRVDIVQDNSI